MLCTERHKIIVGLSSRRGNVPFVTAVSFFFFFTYVVVLAGKDYFVCILHNLVDGIITF